MWQYSGSGCGEKLLVFVFIDPTILLNPVFTWVIDLANIILCLGKAAPMTHTMLTCWIISWCVLLLLWRRIINTCSVLIDYSIHRNCFTVLKPFMVLQEPVLYNHMVPCCPICTVFSCNFVYKYCVYYYRGFYGAVRSSMYQK